MKIAIISDTHFGAGSRLTDPDHIRRTVETLTDVDVLILNGDIVDCSVAHYHEAYAASKPFFVALKEQTKIRRIILNIGNHDYPIFESYGMVQGMQNEPPRPFPHVMNCRIDGNTISMPDLRGHNKKETLHPVEAGKFNLYRQWLNIGWLSRLTRGIPWIISYPNVTINGRYLVTHGHLFGKWGQAAYDLAKVLDLRIETLEDLCALAHPFMSASSTALTNSGKATAKIREFQEAWNGYSPTKSSCERFVIDGVLDRLAELIDSKTSLGWFGELVESRGLSYLVDKIKSYRGKRERGNLNFYVENDEAIYRYEKLSGMTMGNALIYGHTHIANSLNLFMVNFKGATSSENAVYNTGSYLGDDDAGVVIINSENDEIEWR